jgi:hypothetical protein
MGGPVDARCFEPNVGPLAASFHVFIPERRGHGHTPDVEGPITYQLMTDDTIAFLEQVVGAPADLVGHSDGAIVAMQVRRAGRLASPDPGESDVVNKIELDFLTLDPVPTVAAIPRAQQPSAAAGRDR